MKPKDLRRSLKRYRTSTFFALEKSMGVIFDTSVLIAIEKSSLNIERLFMGRENEPFGISVVTVSKLLHRVYRADSEKRRLKRKAS